MSNMGQRAKSADPVGMGVGVRALNEDEDDDDYESEDDRNRALIARLYRALKEPCRVFIELS